MKEQAYDHQKLTEYLLGSLPEAEAERFDELSFTDDDFAAALKSTENELADRYVRGGLNGATLERFQAHYLASPLRRRKVEFAKALQTHTEKSFDVCRSETETTFRKNHRRIFYDSAPVAAMGLRAGGSGTGVFRRLAMEREFASAN